MYWEPTRAAAQARLQQFLPAAGDDYAQWRNHDFGPDDRSNVSALSPWISHRRLTEVEVLDAVLTHHDPATAHHFVQEIGWRTWSKGWLERHADVWSGWQEEAATAWTQVERDPRLMGAWQAAVNGRSGIACFDAWSQELVERNYLHNHARMWFASIWIFTLGLPWSLGAAFFWRHLLDGDAASNTLGWRWVAGLQTPGKTYLATPDNIRRFTDGRFDPQSQLASEAAAPAGIGRPAADPTPPGDPPPRTDAATGLLLTPDDLGVETLDLSGIRHAAVFNPGETAGDSARAEPVRRFRQDLVVDTIEALTAAGIAAHVVTDAEAVVRWCEEQRLQRVWLPWIPVGPIRDGFEPVRARLHSAGVALHAVQRDWDARAWPHADRGFFPFKRQIPRLLEAAGLLDYA